MNQERITARRDPIMQTPDNSSFGFLEEVPNPLRYENPSRDPDEAGMKVASLVPRSLRVLDVGCGTGCISQLVVQERNVTLVGIEPDGQRVAIAQKRGLNVIHGYLSEEFFTQTGTFDVVLFIDVLEHLASPGALLEIVQKGLKPGGKVIVSVPNIAHWSVRSKLLRGTFDYEEFGIMDATHLRWFTRKTLHDLFERTGYEVVAMDSTLGLQLSCYQSSFPFRWLSSSLKRKIARYGITHAPGLFACQHIFVAQVR